MCKAVTHGNHVPVYCDQPASSGSSYGLCFYHEKMKNGHIEPFLEGVKVETTEGIPIFSSTRKVKSK
jgi:hypothetical protein